MAHNIANVKGGRRADGEKRVFWKTADLDAVIPKAAELLFIDPKMGVGPALIQAQKDVLPANRQRPETALRNVGAGKYGARVRAYIQVLSKDLKKREAKLNAPVASTPTPTSAPAVAAAPQTVEKKVEDTGDFMKVLSETTGMDKIAMALARTCAANFETYLEKEIESAYRRVMLKMGTSGVPAAFTVDKATGEGKVVQVLHTGGKSAPIEPPTFKRVKVILAGNMSSDDDYFFKVRMGLEDMYEFVKIRKPGEIHDHRDAKVVVTTMSDDSPMTMAAKTLLKGVSVIHGKTASTVKSWLETQYQFFQEEMLKKVTQQ